MGAAGRQAHELTCLPTVGSCLLGRVTSWGGTGVAGRGPGARPHRHRTQTDRQRQEQDGTRHPPGGAEDRTVKNEMAPSQARKGGRRCRAPHDLAAEGRGVTRQVREKAGGDSRNGHRKGVSSFRLRQAGRGSGGRAISGRRRAARRIKGGAGWAKPTWPAARAASLSPRQAPRCNGGSVVQGVASARGGGGG